MSDKPAKKLMNNRKSPRKAKPAESPAPPAAIAQMPPAPLKIVVPSHARWDILTTPDKIEVDCVCIPESQLKQYRRFNPKVEFVTHPDSVKGLHAKRNWMYQHFGSLFMFDDDVKSVARAYCGMVRTTPTTTVAPALVRTICENLYQQAIDLDCYLFGLSILSTPMQPQKPFRFTGTVMGASYGVRAGSKLHWNERMSSKEDTWISMLNAYHYRKLVIDNRFFVSTHEVYARRGGLSGQRTAANSLKDYDTIRKTFGDYLRQVATQENCWIFDCPF